MGKFSLIHQEVKGLYRSGLPLEQIIERIERIYEMSKTRTVEIVQRSIERTVRNDYYEDDLDN